MSDEKFRVPGSSYSELTRVIIAYGRSNKAMSLDDVSKTAAMDATVVSRNNGFLLAVGLIEGGKSKSATEAGRQLGGALEHVQGEAVSGLWRGIVQASEFLTRLLTSIRIRGGMDEASLRGHIAYSAGQPKTAPVLAGAGAIIDILTIAGLVQEADGKIVALGEGARTDAPGIVRGTSGSLWSEVQFSKPLTKRQGDLVIQLNINAEPADLDTLATKIKKFISDLDAPSD